MHLYENEFVHALVDTSDLYMYNGKLIFTGPLRHKVSFL
jgi:hypothetical protein